MVAKQAVLRYTFLKTNAKEAEAMAQTTMGQRIAEERKKLGLSQEGLGEKMGVSRQAISKWESDGAVPEIDKLISLSKLFGVSMEWLLGVEPKEETSVCAPEQPSPETPKPAFAIPGWLRRYGGIAIVAAALLVLMWLMIYTANISSTEYQYQLDYLNGRISMLESRIMALETVEKAAGQLLAEYSFDADATEDKQQAAVVFTATPHSWQAGDQGYLSINGSGIESMEFPCRWDGSRLTAAAVLEFVDGYELCFTVEHSDGSRQMQLLSDGVLEQLRSAFVPSLSGSVSSGTWLPGENALKLENLSISYLRSGYGEDCPVTWQRISLVLLADGEAVVWDDHFNASTHNDSTATTGGGSWRTVTHTIPLGDWTAQPGQTIELRLYAKMSNGVTASELICSWIVGKDGQWGS